MIPFVNHIFSTDQNTILIQKQNDFLHNTAISIINLGRLDGFFKDKEKRRHDGARYKRDATNISSDERTEVEVDVIEINEDSPMSDVKDGASSDATNTDMEEGKQNSTNELEEATHEVCLLQLLCDAHGHCLETG